MTSGVHVVLFYSHSSPVGAWFSTDALCAFCERAAVFAAAFKASISAFHAANSSACFVKISFSARATVLVKMPEWTSQLRQWACKKCIDGNLQQRGRKILEHLRFSSASATRAAAAFASALLAFAFSFTDFALHSHKAPLQSCHMRLHVIT